MSHPILSVRPACKSPLGHKKGQSQKTGKDYDFFACSKSCLSLAQKLQVYAKDVDLKLIEGIGHGTALVILSEFGNDLSKFPSSKRFCSFLGLCPGTNISGGKVLKHQTNKVTCRAAAALRMAANSLRRSKSWLGDYFRRLLFRLGSAKTITAVAYKLARLVYALLTKSEEYVAKNMEEEEAKAKERKLKRLVKQAEDLGVAIFIPDSLNSEAVTDTSPEAPVNVKKGYK
ncbi:MAG: transposase [Deltaproteobacteria bacterium]|jgi:hypothetical protein|nr:transposase [Deltaproteobacteria bacterium]